jgi:uncharacterized protein YegL
MQVLPVYMLIDSSASMEYRLRAIEDLLLDLVDEFSSSVVLGDQVRVAVLGFSDRAEIILPLSDLTEQRRIPHLQARGGTSWGSAFELLDRTVTHDMRLLRADGVRIFRPLVIFIIDGAPNDNWRPQYAKFREHLRSNLLVVALEEVSQRIVAELEPTTTLKIAGNAPLREIRSRIYRAVNQSLISLTGSTVREPERFAEPPRYRSPEEPPDDLM